MRSPRLGSVSFRYLMNLHPVGFTHTGYENYIIVCRCCEYLVYKIVFDKLGTIRALASTILTLVRRRRNSLDIGRDSISG